MGKGAPFPECAHHPGSSLVAPRRPGLGRWVGGAQGQVASRSSRCKQGAPGRTARGGRAQQGLRTCAPAPSATVKPPSSHTELATELAAWTISSISGESAGDDFLALGVRLQMLL